MNRIGILTFYHVLNYGAVLQCYALKRKVNDLGYRTDVIPYVCDYIAKSENILIGKRFLSRLAKFVSQGFGTWKKRVEFNTFLVEHLGIDLQKQNVNWEEYEQIIVGSDQVWNVKLTGEDYTYFLENIPNTKKIAYAASFGDESLDNGVSNRIVSAVEKFDFVSVREKGHCEILRKYNIDVQNVIDPVFLLAKKEWEQLICPKKKLFKERYILVYCVGKSKKVFDYARGLAARKKLAIIYLNQNILFKEKEMIYKRGVSPTDFLQYISEADYVVTNSFHGTAFSIIFEKKFAVDSKVVEERENRISNLLQSAGLNNCSIDSLCDYEDIDREIDYVNVKARLESVMEKSVSYLVNALK